MASSDRTHQKRFFLALLGCVGLLTLYVFSPYLLTLLIAAAFATIFHPVFVVIDRRLRMRWLSSGITVLIAGVIVLVPLAWIIAQISVSASNLYVALVRGDISLDFLQPTEAYLEQTFPHLKLNAESLLAQTFQWIGSNAGSVLSGTVTTAIKFAIGCFAFYVFVRDGDEFVRKAIQRSPLPSKDTTTIIQRMNVTIHSIIRGNLLVCIGQGLITGILMSVFGVPNPVLWGSLVVLVAIAPGIGPSAVILPAGFYLFSTGGPFPAVTFTALAMAAVWAMSNIAGPILVSQGVKVHELWIIVSVIGGIMMMGPLGFIVGPLAVSVLFTLLDLIPDVMQEMKT